MSFSPKGIVNTSLLRVRKSSTHIVSRGGLGLQFHQLAPLHPFLSWGWPHRTIRSRIFSPCTHRLSSGKSLTNRHIPGSLTHPDVSSLQDNGSLLCLPPKRVLYRWNNTNSSFWYLRVMVTAIFGETGGILVFGRCCQDDAYAHLRRCNLKKK